MSILSEHLPAPPATGEVRRALAGRIPASSSHAVVLTGVRRSGKSTLLAQLLRRAGGPLCVNFEDTRLFGLRPADFPTLLSVIDELAPAPAVVGLDEVQELDEWQRLVRALLDRRRRVTLTGSNASLLGRELGSRLTGRHLSFEVSPFSYPEYLDFTRQAPGPKSLRSYLDHGGFPAYLREREPQILRELLRDIVHRDIVSRHGLRELRHLMNLALFLLANTGQAFSLQRLTKSLGIPGVGQTARSIEYLQDAYLLLAVRKFSPAFRKRIASPAKYYGVDVGLRSANTPQGAPDVGHRLENVVALALRVAGRPFWYAGERDLWECDFVTDRAAIQVCAELTEFNRERELGGLSGALRLGGRRHLVIVTLDQKDRLSLDGKPVDVVPAWEWLSGKSGRDPSI